MLGKKQTGLASRLLAGAVLATPEPQQQLGAPQRHTAGARHNRGSGGSNTATRWRSSTTVRHGGAAPPHGTSVVEESPSWRGEKPRDHRSSTG